MKVAIVHYWLVGMRGGEKVVEALCELFPDADVYTHVYNSERISQTIRDHNVITTFISKLPFARSFYKAYLPLMPLALERLNFDSYDLVISSESGPAKGVLTKPETLHVCYCHTPMRYAWSGYNFYRCTTRGPKRLIIDLIMHRLRLWDYASAARVDYFIANSETVAKRVQKYYRRNAAVVYPPVEHIDAPAAPVETDFYLFVSQLVQYKRADLVIHAFNELRESLMIIGQGEEYKRLKKLAGPTVELLGWQDDQVLRSYYRRCKALIFIAEEDFGIVPVEAMCAGKPVIAFGRGGASETVIDGTTGVLFHEQTSASLMQAIKYFESIRHLFDEAQIMRHGAKFSKEAFKRRMRDLLNSWLRTHQSQQEGHQQASEISQPTGAPSQINKFILV